MRWGKAATVATVATASALGAGAAALVVGRAVSDLSLRPRRAPAGEGGIRVHAVGPQEVELTRTPHTQLPGVYGLTWEPSGHAVLGQVLRTTSQTVVRTLDEGPAPEPGAKVRFTPQVFLGDPRTRFGLDFDEVQVRGELGPMPAWFVPGLREPWVIAVHGPGADRGQVLPLLPTLNAMQVPVLAISYRNDPGAPSSPDGLGHLGGTEWRDVEAAIRLAVDGGAERIVLLGWSVGATMALQAAERSDWRDRIRGLVLDSTVLDLQAVVRGRAERHRLPQPLVELGMLATEGRIDLDQPALDRLADPDALRVPTLLLHSPDDPVAPIAPLRRLASEREELALLQEFPHAEHEALWNSDPDGYLEAVRRFLVPLV